MGNSDLVNTSILACSLYVVPIYCTLITITKYPILPNIIKIRAYSLFAMLQLSRADV